MDLAHNPSANTANHSAASYNDPRYRDTKIVTLVGALVNLLLAFVKLIVGYVGQSQALMADGVHSLSDLLSDGMVLFAAKHSARGADDSHPYGHERVETVITVALGVFLIAVGAGIAYDALRRVIEPELLLQPSLLALVVAGVSIASKEILYHYTMHAAKKHRSKILRANAWHHRSDAVSSIIVFVGVAGTMLGAEFLDAIAALGVALFIGKIGWDLCVESVRELVDTALEPDRIAEIENTIQNVPGVEELHMLRTRQMGGNALVDVHIQVAPKLSVSEGHYISEKVRANLIKNVDEVTDVTVHIDPEDDEIVRLNDQLPPRHKILERLKVAWADIPVSKRIERITLHYLDGKIHVELLLPLDILEQPQTAKEIEQSFARVAMEDSIVSNIKLMYH
jgi:cation diffusion facilitator family transporter